MQWWREARFRMFIHWGDYAQLAGNYKGHQVGRGGEWIMNRAKIPVMEYQQFAKQFNPVKYNADAWVKTARDAGMKYIVITAPLSNTSNTSLKDGNSITLVSHKKIALVCV